MECKDCRFTLPCYAGKFGEFGPEGINTSLCPSCGRLSVEIYQQNVVWTFFCEERVKRDEDRVFWKEKRNKQGKVDANVRRLRIPRNNRGQEPATAYYASDEDKQYWNVKRALPLHLCYRCWNSAPFSGSHVVDLDMKPRKNAKRSAHDGVRLHLPLHPKHRKRKGARAKYQRRRKIRGGERWPSETSAERANAKREKRSIFSKGHKHFAKKR